MPKVCPNPECPDLELNGEPGEYVDTVESCAVCGATLVTVTEPEQDRPRDRDAVPILPTPADLDLVEVCVTADATEAAVVRSILEGAGIQWVESDPAPHGLMGWGRVVVGAYATVGPVRFQVRTDNAHEALARLSAGGPESAPEG